MSIEVTIKQKLFSKKPMPLEIILGDELRYGAWSNDVLTADEMGEGEFVAYHPDHVGRGFSVEWTPTETKQIYLRLPQPTSALEYDDFYAAIARMVNHWGGKLLVEGQRLTLEAFLSSKEDMLDFNRRIVKQFAGEVLAGEHDTLTTYAAFCPLDIGKPEAERFLQDPDAFGAWLHDRQSTDATFATADFYLDEGDGHPYAVFILYADTTYVLPGEKPTVPLGLVDPSTGRALECTDYRVMLGVDGADAPIAKLTYDEFYGKLPAGKLTRFDGKRMLMSSLTEADMSALYGAGTD